MKKEIGVVKGFFLYFDQCDSLNELSDEQCGKLLKAMVDRFQNKEHEITDPMLKVAFRFFEASFKRDCEKYKDKCTQLQANANSKKKPTKGNQTQADDSNCNQMQADATKGNQTQADDSKSTQYNTIQKETKQNEISPPTPQGGSEGDRNAISQIPPAKDSDEPDIAFCELREYYDTHFKNEGPKTGFVEFKAFIAKKKYFPYADVYRDLDAREKNKFWNQGFAPSLATYIRDEYWRSKPVNQHKPVNITQFDQRQAEINARHQELVAQVGW